MAENVLSHNEPSKGKQGQRNLTGVFLVACLVVLVLCQGGFNGLVPCVLGIATWLVVGILAVRGGKEKRDAGLVPLLFSALAFAYLLSMIVNGLTITTVSETGAWFAVAGFSFLADAQSARHRDQTFLWLTWVGILSAVVGLVMYAQMIPLDGMIVEGRLYFFFQYANTAGAWFAAFAAVCAVSRKRAVRACLPLPLTALFLTQSLGAILAFVLVIIFVCLKRARADLWSELFVLMLQCPIAVAVFVGLVQIQGPMSLVFIALAILICWFWGRAEDALLVRVDSRQCFIVCLATCVMACGGVIVLLCERVQSAAATFVERAFHVVDGISLWLTSPAVGVGPDNWQYLYPYVQTAQYHTSVIHNSYIQVLVDVGVLGFGLFLAILAVGLRFLLLQREMGEGPCCIAFVIALHSLVDLDFQFAAAACLFALCVSDSRGLRAPVKKLVVGSAVSVAGVCLCALGFLAQTSLLGINLANSLRDYSEVRALFEGNHLAEDDVLAQTAYLRALYEMKDYSRIAAFYGKNGVSSDEQALYAAVAFYQMGDIGTAGSILVGELERQPYNDEFFVGVRAVIDTYGLDADLKDRYNAAVARANTLAGETPAILSPRYLDVSI